MKEKQTQEITKENMIRIYDEGLLKRLNWKEQRVDS